MVDFFQKPNVEFILFEGCVVICVKYNCVAEPNRNISRRRSNDNAIQAGVHHSAPNISNSFIINTNINRNSDSEQSSPPPPTAIPSTPKQMMTSQPIPSPPESTPPPPQSNPSVPNTTHRLHRSLMPRLIDQDDNTTSNTLPPAVSPPQAAVPLTAQPRSCMVTPLGRGWVHYVMPSLTDVRVGGTLAVHKQWLSGIFGEYDRFSTLESLMTARFLGNFPKAANPAFLAQFLAAKLGPWNRQTSPFALSSKYGLLDFFSGKEQRFGLLFLNEFQEYMKHSVRYQQRTDMPGLMLLAKFLLILDINILRAEVFRPQTSKRNVMNTMRRAILQQRQNKQRRRMINTTTSMNTANARNMNRENANPNTPNRENTNMKGKNARRNRKENKKDMKKEQKVKQESYIDLTSD